MKRFVILIILIISITILCSCSNKEEELKQTDTTKSECTDSNQKKADCTGCPSAKSNEVIVTDKNVIKENHLITFIELGSVRCIPCKKMQPVMDAIEKKYGQQIKIIFYDVWKEDQHKYAEQYGIRIIPTQIFIDKDGKEIEFVYFFRPPDFCKGQDEETRWTPRTWIEDQDAETYQEMTARWSGVKRLFQSDPWQGQGPDCPAGRMAFMAAYNMDKFREFVFNSTFLKRYKVKPEVLKRIKSSDTQLLKLGLEWIGFYVWGIRSKHISKSPNIF